MHIDTCVVFCVLGHVVHMRREGFFIFIHGCLQCLSVHKVVTANRRRRANSLTLIAPGIYSSCTSAAVAETC